jgi:hypothetical protein
MVDLTQRPVVAIFPMAAGQINRIPGTWQPEWEPAAVVVYHQQSCFSVIFEQPEAPLRLVKDFFPLNFEEVALSAGPASA